ncbi:hypothetical protein V0R37_08880 [Pollutimonas sp. H1-120]|uniref:hypothetical protein n=1 Tax=Pollutimonas sp. H1-120 TaxID=3148824 RepID=UPI003B5184DD
MTGAKTYAGGAAQHKRLGGTRNNGFPMTARLVNGLHLAATPTFAVMALLTGLSDDPMNQICSIGAGSPIAGMLPMYLLMSVFHSPPWIRLMRVSTRKWK